MKVFVYYNLHRQCWSIKALEGNRKGRVIKHAASVLLGDAVPKVSQKGRERVLKEKRKNVHAGIVGTLLAISQQLELNLCRTDRVTYNPYKYSGFVYAESEQPFTYADTAVMTDRAVYV